MKNFRASIAGLLTLALTLLPFSMPAVHAAATSQVTHALLCAPDAAVNAPGPRRIVNPNTNNAYVINGSGCALVVGADIGYMLTQGFTYGPNILTAQASALSSSSTTAVSSGITLPAYGWIVGIVLCETAGNAVTGGVNIGDAGSATRFASAVTLGANACVTIADSALTRIYAPSGVPTADPILLAAATSWNSALVNVTLLYTYY